MELVGEDSSNTIIDAQQQNVVMNISQAQTSETIIKNFTLMNGITPGEATGLEEEESLLTMLVPRLKIFK